MSHPHQDWKKVILNNNRPFGNINNNNHPFKDINNNKKPEDFDPSNIQKVNTSSNELGKAISKARTEKKLSQVDLDKKCCFQANTIKNYENGTAIVNSNQITKMNSVLGVVLPRPKKIKQKNNE
jgi:putative transcription factor